MARPSDISTKVVSFRIPMKDYIKLLTLATEKGLSISDYLLMKVYGPDGEIIEGKTLAGAESEPAAGPDPVQTPEVIAEPVPELKLETETALSGVPKKPSKQRSAQKANTTKKATKKLSKSATEAKTTKREEEKRRKQQQAKEQQKAKVREAQARKVQREELQQAIKNYQSEYKRYEKIAKEAKYRMENEPTTAGTMARDKPQIESAERNMANLEKAIAAAKREIAQLK